MPLSLRFCLALVGAFWLASAAVIATAADVPVTLVDTLNADPSTQIPAPASSGYALLYSQYVGPLFTLEKPTTITEIGGFFYNRCVSSDGNVPISPCPPLKVELRLSVSGVPDTSEVLATYNLGPNLVSDPPMYGYAFATPNVLLPAGDYFAIFAPEDHDIGILLACGMGCFPEPSASYFAGFATFGVLHPLSNRSLIEYNEGAVRVLGTTREFAATIDIRPGAFPNTIKLHSGGTVAVAILSSGTFDATTVDPMSVLLAGEPVQIRKNGTPMASLVDVDGDGLADLLVHFATSDLQLTPSDTVAALRATTFDGASVTGQDSVVVSN
jgi:hypothetical protein